MKIVGRIVNPPNTGVHMRRRKRNVVYVSADDDFAEREPKGGKSSITSGHNPVRSQPPNQQTISIQREKKGRGGKQVDRFARFSTIQQSIKYVGQAA